MIMSQMKLLLLISIGLIAKSVAFKMNTTIDSGIPDNMNINTRPFVRIGKGLYYFEPKLKVNWYEANERCHQLDAELIAFESIDEWIAVNKYLKDKSIEEEYWTSGNDLAKQHKHVWLANGQVISLTGIWAAGQPDNFKNAEHCDLLGYKLKPSDRRGLNDARCYDVHQYICEKQQPQTATIVVW